MLTNFISEVKIYKERLTTKCAIIFLLFAVLLHVLIRSVSIYENTESPKLHKIFSPISPLYKASFIKACNSLWSFLGLP